MVDNAITRRRIEVLEHAVKRARVEAHKVSIQRLAVWLNPMSKAHADLKARYAALVKIERLHEAQP